MNVGENIMKQVVERKKLGVIHGILLIVGLVAVLIVLNFLCMYYLSALLGYQPASLVFWFFGALIAWQMLRVFVMKYEYEMNADVLRLNRSYGKRPRHIEDIYLNRLLFVGSVEDAKQRYPKARKVTAIHGSVDLPVTAVVYKTSDDTHMALIQANDELKVRLMERMKQK